MTFLTRHQTQQEVIESLSKAVLKAIEQEPDAVVMKDLLDDTDQRFRLKYTLGGWQTSKPKAGGSLSFDGTAKGSLESKTVESSPFLKSTLSAIRKIAAAARHEIELILGALDKLKDEERSYALDEMQQAGERSEEYLDLVNAVIDEIEERFAKLPTGKFSKSSSGWPEAWCYSAPADQRDSFLQAVRWFCSNTKEEWASLLTPLVTGIRVSGPFRPEWVPAEEDYDHVFRDTQGLDQEKPTTELSSETTSLFGQILFVESGKDSLKSQSARKRPTPSNRA